MAWIEPATVGGAHVVLELLFLGHAFETLGANPVAIKTHA
jgi:hypothetical protein